ncbi:MAG: flagellar protein FlgN [Succinivibrio sp.]|nr:flagellar protein FlgN [Succinivibrio sp.]
MVFTKNMFKPAAQVAAAQIKPITSYLKEQDALLDELRKLLEDERAAIRDRDMKGLPKLTEKKSNMMLQLQSNDQRLKLHPQAAELKTLYLTSVNQIKSKLTECKRCNEINGKLIRLCLNSTKRVFGLLMDMRDKDTKNMTYTQKGNTIARGVQRLSIEC